jgi:hypothetical protein
MPKQPLHLSGDESETEGEGGERPSVEAGVRNSVLAVLGHPAGLYAVAVRRLWANHFRVNVLIGSDITTVQIAHSYFVEVGAKGAIRKSTPPITRLYV